MDQSPYRPHKAKDQSKTVRDSNMQWVIASHAAEDPVTIMNSPFISISAT